MTASASAKTLPSMAVASTAGLGGRVATVGFCVLPGHADSAGRRTSKGFAFHIPLVQSKSAGSKELPVAEFGSELMARPLET